jgi:hypothetical protein
VQPNFGVKFLEIAPLAHFTALPEFATQRDPLRAALTWLRDGIPPAALAVFLDPSATIAPSIAPIVIDIPAAAVDLARAVEERADTLLLDTIERNEVASSVLRRNSQSVNACRSASGTAELTRCHKISRAEISLAIAAGALAVESDDEQQDTDHCRAEVVGRWQATRLLAR